MHYSWPLSKETHINLPKRPNQKVQQHVTRPNPLLQLSTNHAKHWVKAYLHRKLKWCLLSMRIWMSTVCCFRVRLARVKWVKDGLRVTVAWRLNEEPRTLQSILTRSKVYRQLTCKVTLIQSNLSHLLGTKRKKSFSNSSKSNRNKKKKLHKMMWNNALKRI